MALQLNLSEMAIAVPARKCGGNCSRRGGGFICPLRTGSAHLPHRVLAAWCARILRTSMYVYMFDTWEEPG